MPHGGEGHKTKFKKKMSENKRQQRQRAMQAGTHGLGLALVQQPVSKFEVKT